MANGFGETIAAVLGMPKTRQVAQPKKLNTTHIDRKGAVPQRKLGLPLNILFL